jgi:hypothetical protein
VYDVTVRVPGLGFGTDSIEWPRPVQPGEIPRMAAIIGQRLGVSHARIVEIREHPEGVHTGNAVSIQQFLALIKEN